MRTRRIRFGSRQDRWARGLYRRAFPENERLAWALVHLLSLRRGIDLVAWWDRAPAPPEAPAGACGPAAPAWEAEPCALTWTVRRPGSQLLYLFYLAVDDAARGRGLGTRLLAELRRRHPGCTVVLDIEPVIEEADNAEQRRRRLAFYERAGFRDTGYATVEPSEEYWTLVREAPGTRFRPDDFRATLRYLDCGFSTVRLVPRS